jgi:HNH endonuclease
MVGFEYPTDPHARRHGPEGYEDYNSYRDWLRDEFTFRCVYCLHREQWYGRGATFHIDHSTPVTKDLGGKCDYANLLYACATCNEAKKAILGVPDPCKVAFRDCLRIMADGRVEALNDDGEKLRQVLRLDSERNVRSRSRWMRDLETLRRANPGLYQEFMGFPDDLPDLRKKHVSNNTKPEGATNCYFALRERGLLPAMY